eukprot:249574_1
MSADHNNAKREAKKKELVIEIISLVNREYLLTRGAYIIFDAKHETVDLMASELAPYYGSKKFKKCKQNAKKWILSALKKYRKIASKIRYQAQQHRNASNQALNTPISTLTTLFGTPLTSTVTIPNFLSPTDTHFLSTTNSQINHVSVRNTYDQAHEPPMSSLSTPFTTPFSNAVTVPNIAPHNINQPSVRYVAETVCNTKPDHNPFRTMPIFSMHGRENMLLKCKGCRQYFGKSVSRHQCLKCKGFYCPIHCPQSGVCQPCKQLLAPKNVIINRKSEFVQFVNEYPTLNTFYFRDDNLNEYQLFQHDKYCNPWTESETDAYLTKPTANSFYTLRPDIQTRRFTLGRYGCRSRDITYGTWTAEGDKFDVITLYDVLPKVYRKGIVDRVYTQWDYYDQVNQCKPIWNLKFDPMGNGYSASVSKCRTTCNGLRGWPTKKGVKEKTFSSDYSVRDLFSSDSEFVQHCNFTDDLLDIMISLQIPNVQRTFFSKGKDKYGSLQFSGLGYHHGAGLFPHWDIAEFDKVVATGCAGIDPLPNEMFGESVLGWSAHTRTAAYSNMTIRRFPGDIIIFFGDAAANKKHFVPPVFVQRCCHVQWRRWLG